MGKRIDLTGQTINGIKVLGFAYRGGGKAQKAFWNCECYCGRLFVVDGYKLRTGHTRSCGCLHDKMTGDRRRLHGDSQTRLYKIWKDMRKRCSEKATGDAKKNYFLKGIGVCDEWGEYERFKEWALCNGYNDDLTIDRKDNSKGYCPENCRWTTRFVQNNNKTDNLLLTYKGRTQNLSSWCRELGLSYKMVESRINKSHWSVEDAFEKPKRTWPSIATV